MHVAGAWEKGVMDHTVELMRQREDDVHGSMGATRGCLDASKPTFECVASQSCLAQRIEGRRTSVCMLSSKNDHYWRHEVNEAWLSRWSLERALWLGLGFLLSTDDQRLKAVACSFSAPGPSRRHTWVQLKLAPRQASTSLSWSWREKIYSTRVTLHIQQTPGPDYLERRATMLPLQVKRRERMKHGGK